MVYIVILVDSVETSVVVVAHHHAEKRVASLRQRAVIRMVIPKRQIERRLRTTPISKDTKYLNNQSLPSCSTQQVLVKVVVTR